MKEEHCMISLKGKGLKLKCLKDNNGNGIYLNPYESKNKGSGIFINPYKD